MHDDGRQAPLAFYRASYGLQLREDRRRGVVGPRLAALHLPRSYTFFPLQFFFLSSRIMLAANGSIMYGRCGRNFLSHAWYGPMLLDGYNMQVYIISHQALHFVKDASIKEIKGSIYDGVVN